MLNISALFDGRQTDEKRLLAFGFKNDGCNYVFSTKLADGQFVMTVCISAVWKVLTEVVDSETGESYALVKISDANGAFVGNVRKEYENILMAIYEKCFDKNIFKSDYAKLIISYIEDKYKDKIEFLWTKFPKNAIFRRKDNAKWYVALLTVAKRKIGKDGNGDIEIIDLRIEPSEMDALIDGKKYFLGYHMNKKHWFTICLDGSVKIENIFNYIDASYILANK